jgi:hypothetical protein
MEDIAMHPLLFAFLFVTLGGLLAAVAFLILLRSTPGTTVVYSSLERMRAIGHLSAFKAYTKEIVTETNHPWGETGSKYFSWVLSKKKLAIIFEFEVDFRYDLRSPDFHIAQSAPGQYIIKMPPCLHEVHIRNIRFYDEQRARWFPWFLPEILNGFYVKGFTPEDKNRLLDTAREEAQRNAMDLIGQLEPDVQRSAEATLQSIARTLGAEKLEFVFAPQVDLRLNVGISNTVALGDSERALAISGQAGRSGR